MRLTPAQQDAAARRELEERGVDHWVIAELDAEWADHVVKQRAIARGDSHAPSEDNRAA